MPGVRVRFGTISVVTLDRGPRVFRRGFGAGS